MNDNSSSRDRILSRIRQGKPAPVDAPAIPDFGWPGDIVENFEKHLRSFDGECMRFGSRQEALDWLKANISTQHDKVVCSAIPDFEGTVTPTDYPDPHRATDVDICVAQGLMGVGEMGSVLVTANSLGLEACALFCTDLYLLLDASTMVQGMHAAYSRLGSSLRNDTYSSFFTGPSATADIEAVHITGAQAEISLTVLLYGA